MLAMPTRYLRGDETTIEQCPEERARLVRLLVESTGITADPYSLEDDTRTAVMERPSYLGRPRPSRTGTAPMPTHRPPPAPSRSSLITPALALVLGVVVTLAIGSALILWRFETLSRRLSPTDSSGEPGAQATATLRASDYA